MDKQEIEITGEDYSPEMLFTISVRKYNAIVGVVECAALLPGLYLFPHNDAALQDAMEGLTVALAELLKASL